MKRQTKLNLALMSSAFVMALGATILIVREPTERLTVEALEAAMQRWREAGVQSYDLRYRMHGSIYDIKSRGGVVVEATVNGQRPLVNDYSDYGVEGLFRTLELELENVTDPHGPFAGRASAVVMRVRFNAGFGYIERYLRGSGGYGRSVAIELIEFVPIK